MTETQSDELLIGKLRERGLRVTSQRLVIHRVLSARDQHMTAEQVLESISGTLPGTSLPTVYATLELFEELRLVRRVSTGTGAVLFDSSTQPHAHTVCRRCGMLEDLDEPVRNARALKRARESGFSPDHAQLVIWGLCADCRRAEARPARGSARPAQLVGA